MLTDEIGSVEVLLDKALKNNPHYRTLQQIRGIGPVLAAHTGPGLLGVGGIPAALLD